MDGGRDSEMEERRLIRDRGMEFGMDGWMVMFGFQALTSADKKTELIGMTDKKINTTYMLKTSK